MTTQPNTLEYNKLSPLLEEVLGCSTPVESIKRKLRYDIGVDDDTHWALVSIAAKNKLHQEDFVEQLLVEFVAEHRAAMDLRKGIEEAAS
jgi:hypothetical protein